MVNRSPTSNYQFRRCHTRIMAPTPTTVKASKGKKLRSKVPANSAPPVRSKRQLKCTKCLKTHLPPTGAGCKANANPPTDNLNSTLRGEQPTAINAEANISPIASPVRSFPQPGAAAAQAPGLQVPNPPGPSTDPPTNTGRKPQTAEERRSEKIVGYSRSVS